MNEDEDKEGKEVEEVKEVAEGTPLFLYKRRRDQDLAKGVGGTEFKTERRGAEDADDR
jgi:hypothetical protein